MSTTSNSRATVEDLERAVLDQLAASEEALVALAADLIGFDTTAREPADPPRQEQALQEYLARRLEAAGATVALWEPDAAEIGGDRQVPAGLTFAGRPQLAATFRGAGGGRSLLLNGHIDAVSAEPVEQWTSDPWRAEVRDGRLYGRGASDMKGGIACMVLAAETLARAGSTLAGDLIVNTNTDEESSGAGSLACAAHGIGADAGICPEGTGHDLWIACRGSISVKITVAGRAGHVEIRQPDWREGGAVNAIEKAEIVLRAIHDLQADWSARPAHRHAVLMSPSVIPTVIRGGDWFVTYPATCEITVNVNYLPVNADGEGYGREVAAEIEQAVRRATDADEWLREHPPAFEWGPDLPPFDVSPDHPIVATVVEAGRRVGVDPALGATDSWFDAGSFVRSGRAAMIGYGPPPGSIHGVDEFVTVSDLVRCAQTLALTAIRWCGVGGDR